MPLSNIQILLHIGTHKTGSTSIQSFCFRNRRTLLQQGLLYPETFVKWHGHHPLPWSVGLPHIHKDPSLDITRIVRMIESEIASASAQRVLLSSEDFEYLHREAVARLLSQFQEAEVRVIAYLRRQDELLESEYAHNVVADEVRYVGTIHDFYMSQNPIARYDYEELLNKWESGPRRPTITVRPFEPRQFHGGSLLRDFCHSIGVTWDDQYTLPTGNETNARLPVAAVLALKELNRLDLPTRQRVEIIKILRDATTVASTASTPASLLSERNRTDFYRLFRDSNRRVAMRYLDRAEGELFLDVE